jgi:hypothetical protein
MSDAQMAFRTFAVDSPYAAQTLHMRLTKRKAELLEQVATGWAKDWSDYNRKVGVLEGVMEAILLCEDMMKQDRA